MRLQCLIAAVLWLTEGPHAQPLVRLDADDLGFSQRLPVAGHEVQVLLPVANPGPETVRVHGTLSCQAVADHGVRDELAPASIDFDLPPSAARDVPLTWTPRETGFYTLRLTLSLLDRRPVRATFGPVAVVARDLYFAWFGAPKHFRWCNVPTTVKPGDEAWWLRRGAIPCQWTGGVCYREWSQAQFVEHYRAPWIAIDEVGGPGEDTDKFIGALRELEAEPGERFNAIWFMGTHDYWRDVTDVVDLFLPEVYLNYRSNHLGQIDTYLEGTRRAGVLDRTVFGLGINLIRDEQSGEVRVAPTKDDVLRQFRYLKRVAPEMPGLGFFTSDSAAPGVAEYADELCGEYFVKPVCTLLDGGLSIADGQPRRAVITLANHGGMTARDVRLRVAQRTSDGRALLDRTVTVHRLDSLQRREVSVPLARAAGVGLVSAEILPSESYTLLDARAEEPVAPRDLLPLALRPALALLQLPPWDEGDRTTVPVQWTFPHPVNAVRVVEIGADGKTIADAPSLALTEDGETAVRWVAAGLTSPGQRRYFALLPEAPTPCSPTLTVERVGGKLRVTSPHYVAELDPATDGLTSLAPTGAENMLSSPWRLNCVGHEGFGAPQVVESPGWLCVTVPFESELATGHSRYVFCALSPAIEVSRVLRPKAPLTVEGASDSAHLPQRGGTYALQPGVGGVIERGELRDTTEYRDLLFGCLAGLPTERNATQAGWMDFSWQPADAPGLGLALAERWRDAAFGSYDVTRLYDAADWLEITYVWGKPTTLTREQTCRYFLIPHGRLDMAATPVPPARGVWETLHNPIRALPG
jgi:hypothetical protein